ncbi:MAG: hypothetical protein ACFFDP_04715 [Promethearchaeota archaeon]
MSSSSSKRKHEGDLVLGALAGKVDATAEIARTEKALVQVDSGTLYFPVIRAGVEVGGVFFGSGQVIIDAIVETRRGAIGQSKELVWDGSLFLLSTSAEWVPPSILPVGDKELRSHNLDSKEAAEERAQQLFARYLDEGNSWVDDVFVLRRKGWCIIILDKNEGKTRILASRDRIVLNRSDASLIIKGNHMVETEGKSKVIVSGRRGYVFRIG